MLEVAPLQFAAKDVTWVASKLQGSTGPVGAEEVEMRNRLIQLEEVSLAWQEELAVWAEWLSNTSPPWAAYHVIIACCLVALDKSPEVPLMGIRELLCCILVKLVLRTIGDKAKTTCSSLQLCTGLEAGIEGLVHAVAHRRAEHLAVPPAIPTEPGDNKAEADAGQEGGEDLMLPGLHIQPPDLAGEAGVEEAQGGMEDDDEEDIEMPGLITQLSDLDGKEDEG
eukprot:10062491-Ditylum_brightwellii.AAC.2